MMSELKASTGAEFQFLVDSGAFEHLNATGSASLDFRDRPSCSVSVAALGYQQDTHYIFCDM